MPVIKVRARARAWVRVCVGGGLINLTLKFLPVQRRVKEFRQKDLENKEDKIKKKKIKQKRKTSIASD